MGKMFVIQIQWVWRGLFKGCIQDSSQLGDHAVEDDPTQLKCETYSLLQLIMEVPLIAWATCSGNLCGESYQILEQQ